MDVVGNRIDAYVYGGWMEVPELGFSELVQMYAPANANYGSQVLLGRSFLSKFILNYDGPNETFVFSRPLGLSPPIDDE